MLLWAMDAVDIQAPMELFELDMLPSCGQYDPIRYASSKVAEAGTIVWSFQTTAPVAVEIFGLVRDQAPGIAAGGLDPDSFRVTIDDDPEFTWVYGCDTVAWSKPRWGWIPVRRVVGDACPATLVTYDLEPGDHTIRLLNREPEAFGRTAAIAALYVAVTPAPDPYTVYDPGS